MVLSRNSKFFFIYVKNCFDRLIAINPKKLKKVMRCSECVLELLKFHYRSRYDVDSKNGWKESGECRPHQRPVPKRSVLSRDKQRLYKLISPELPETEFSVNFSFIIYQCFRILQLIIDNFRILHHALNSFGVSQSQQSNQTIQFVILLKIL